MTSVDSSSSTPAKKQKGSELRPAPCASPSEMGSPCLALSRSKAALHRRRIDTEADFYAHAQTDTPGRTSIARRRRCLHAGGRSGSRPLRPKEDMLQHDELSLQERVSDLEKKILEQTDEITCLRSTIADLLRRMNQLEGRAPVITNSNSHATTPTKVSPSPPQHPVVHNRHSFHRQRHRSACVCVLNAEEGTVRMYLRGRPIVMHIPSEQLHDYSLMKVNSAPSQRLKLEWVYPCCALRLAEHLICITYGYRGRDCRANLFLLPTGEMVYFIAAVVVLYNVEEQIQRHYLGHTDDIKCLAVHPNKLLIATGQVASIDRRERKPHVRIWDSVSLNTLHIIGVGDFERAVSCIAFSKMDGGSILCAVDDSSEHTISLWDWQRGERGVKIHRDQGVNDSPRVFVNYRMLLPVCVHRRSELSRREPADDRRPPLPLTLVSQSASEAVLAVEFHPMDRHTLVTLGKGHIHFWDMEGGTLAKRLGLFEKSNKPKYVLCMTFTEHGELLTGDSNGNIMVWQRGKSLLIVCSNKVCRTVVGAHDGPLFSICAMKDGTIVTGGAKDRKVVQWDANLTRTGQEARLPDMAGGIRTLAQGKGSLLLIGTTRNSILQGTFSLNFSTVVQGHTEEIWALAVHPTQNQFVTGGYDCQVHLWDTLSHSVVWSRDLGEQAQAACFSPDGSVLVLTTRTGRWSVVDSSTRQLYSMHTDGTEPIDAVAFSPNGQLLALGSRDSFIYVYQVSEEGRKYNRISRCSGHSSFVIHLDWAVDSTYFRSCSGDYELLYWNALVCRQVTNMSITRDLKWHTQTCTIGFSVFGIWPENADGTDINTCARSHSCRLLATGDDFGKVRLFAYPASEPKCLSHMYGGHSSHVTAVDFLPDDNRLISLGGRDCAVLQWAVV
ncbi:hypothetical protein HPB48_023708 [Haemaphysalis longicornis]|uniref:Echinoderm microtubule-associated protein-like 1 n=1 Tax=Haemaphysalis longicornis TaxID=44386 RepID=A0A9J6H7D3_HAELO|nr:hypothetical protein HPB48_023708 [Haemaphysalis longicornis]